MGPGLGVRLRPRCRSDGGNLVRPDRRPLETELLRTPGSPQRCRRPPDAEAFMRKSSRSCVFDGHLLKATRRYVTTLVLPSQRRQSKNLQRSTVKAPRRNAYSDRPVRYTYDEHRSAHPHWPTGRDGRRGGLERAVATREQRSASSTRGLEGIGGTDSIQSTVVHFIGVSDAVDEPCVGRVHPNTIASREIS